MPIEALKRIFQVPPIKKEKEVHVPPYGQRKSKSQKEDKKKDSGKIDLKI